MANPEVVLVQATTSYLEGFEHKSERSEPYPVTRSHGLELQSQGFAVIVPPKADEHPAASSVVEPETPPAAPVRRGPGRPPKAR